MVFVWFAAGVIFGSIVTNIVMWFRTGYGTLRIDSTNPEKDIYRFEISDGDIDKLPKKKRIMLRIDHNANLSR